MRKGHLLRKKKILFVNENPDYENLVIDILETENPGNRVILMQDGKSVIDYLQKTDQVDDNIEKSAEISLIILDLKMPIVEGMDALKFIKSNQRFCSIPVIIMSTNSDNRTIDEVYKSGANGYITRTDPYKDFIENLKILKGYC